MISILSLVMVYDDGFRVQFNLFTLKKMVTSPLFIVYMNYFKFVYVYHENKKKPIGRENLSESKNLYNFIEL